MPSYQSAPTFEHGAAGRLGVLLVNIGTPDEPAPRAVCRFLEEFLSDPRVVEMPRWLWWPILHGFVLRVRPERSARNYRKIWTEQGSPLLVHSQAIAKALQLHIGSHTGSHIEPHIDSPLGSRVELRLEGDVSVALGMSYGNPSLESALEELHAADARRILVLPLYPQYSGSTTGSAFDIVTALLARRRWVPELRFVNHYHDEPGYISAIAGSIRDYRERNGTADKLLFSFHGLPQEMRDRGDPYHCQCLKTARLVAEALDLTDAAWVVAFQSRVGRGEWLRPYTNETVAALARDGIKSLDVVCPGFAADCLETLEEIAMQYRDLFIASGGRQLNYLPALNARDEHIRFLGGLIARHAGGWPETASDLRMGVDKQGNDDSRQRALALGAPR